MMGCSNYRKHAIVGNNKWQVLIGGPMLLLMLMGLVMLKFPPAGLGRCRWWWECLVLALICTHRRWESAGSVSAAERASIAGLTRVSSIRSSPALGVVEHGGYSRVFPGVLSTWGLTSGRVRGRSPGPLHRMKVLCRETPTH